MRRPPAAYIMLLVALLVVGVVAALIFFGVPPFDNIATFVVTTAIGFVLLLILGVVGGAFLGMLLAHRMLANREFTPFERTVLESLQDIRTRLDALEKREKEPPPQARR